MDRDHKGTAYLPQYQRQKCQVHAIKQWQISSRQGTTECDIFFVYTGLDELDWMSLSANTLIEQTKLYGINSKIHYCTS